jgi:hypothetical protein
MKAERFTLAVLLTACTSPSSAQDDKEAPALAPKASVAITTNASPQPAIREETNWTALSNKTVSVIAANRGVKVESVRLTAKSAPKVGSFEIDLSNATNCVAEAEALSRQLGGTFSVVLDEASKDGLLRTNRTFRNGAIRQIVAPPGNKPIGAGERRLVVWPDGARPAAPTGL